MNTITSICTGYACCRNFFFQSYLNVSTVPSNGVLKRRYSVILLHIFQLLEPLHHVMVHPVHCILLKDNTCDQLVSRLAAMWQHCSQDTARCSRICWAICHSLKINVFTSRGSDTLRIEAVCCAFCVCLIFSEHLNRQKACILSRWSCV
jgi:hypothetical protein